MKHSLWKNWIIISYQSLKLIAFLSSRKNEIEEIAIKVAEEK